MELRVLRYFMTIAREGSITSAANVLHVTQPTLSRQIRDLENELGQKLFIRGSHHMTLTAEGMVLRKRAEEILSMVDKTEAEFHAMESTVSGDIYIGSGETQAIQHIAEIAKEIREDHPGIHYHLYSGNAEDVTERLDKGLLDFGILIQPADISKYDYINIPAKDTWGVIVRRDSPFAEKTSIRKEDLLHVPLICSRQAISKSRQNNEFTAWFGEDFEKLDIRVGTVLECESVPKMKKLLKFKIADGLENRTIVSGIAQHYQPEELVGKQVLFIANLAPRQFKNGLVSEGMILSAENYDGALAVTSLLREVKPGSEVK